MQEHRPEPGLPPDDLASLLIANPGAEEGIGSTPEWLVAQARRAIARGGSALTAFRNLNRNERVAADDRSVLVTVDEWPAAEDAPADLPPRQGPVILGIDLGGSRSMSAAAVYWPETGRLEAVGAFPCRPGLADRGAADAVAGRYEEMASRAELVTMGDTTVSVDRVLAEVVGLLDGQAPAAIMGDRFRHAESLEALRGAGLDRVPGVWRGMGWRDGSEDVEQFRRALFERRVRVAPSLLLRSAFADAITIVDPAGNHKLAKARSTGRIDAAAAAMLAVAQRVRISPGPGGRSRPSASTSGRACREANPDGLARSAVDLLPVRRNGREWQDGCLAAVAGNEILRAPRHLGGTRWNTSTGPMSEDGRGPDEPLGSAPVSGSCPRTPTAGIQIRIALMNRVPLLGGAGIRGTARRAAGQDTNSPNDASRNTI